MIILEKPKDVKIKMLGLQKIRTDTLYRPFFYMKINQMEEGFIILNLLTYQLIYLTSEEMENFNSESKQMDSTIEFLIKHWFLVPDSNNDLNLVKQVENLICLTNKIYTAPKYGSFTILPTTDCNARCFYCFEKDANKKKMTHQISNDVADFILKNKVNDRISLRWFGGEPLYNSESIDIICNKLNLNNVDFSSHMVTNGYLFDDALVKKAVELWNLNSVQITLDGTEKKYNRIKNYIYENENAFLRVLNNIELLLIKDVKVKVRMNMDQFNVDDLYILTDELFERFGEFENFKLYCALIFEESCAHMKNADTETRCDLLKKQKKLEEYIMERGHYNFHSKLYSEGLCNCMADNDASIMILPDGNLGKCQSFVDSNFVGNIYNDEINFKMLNWYKEIRTISNDCDDCIFRPACVHPKCCIVSIKNCTDDDKMVFHNRLNKRIQGYYKKLVNRREKYETEI